MGHAEVGDQMLEYFLEWLWRYEARTLLGDKEFLSGGGLFGMGTPGKWGCLGGLGIEQT